MEGERQFITGTIHQQTLAENNWWRHRDVSLIVLPESSDEKIRVLKKTKEKYSEVHC